MACGGAVRFDDTLVTLRARAFEAKAVSITHTLAGTYSSFSETASRIRVFRWPHAQILSASRVDLARWRAKCASNRAVFGISMSVTDILTMCENDICALTKQALLTFLSWGLTDGQTFADGLSYSRLPEAVIKKTQLALSQIERFTRL